MTPMRPQTNQARLRGAVLCAALLLTFFLAAPVEAQGCRQTGKNMQCNAFGTISMDSQRDIRGRPIDLAVEVLLNTAYAEQNARWFLFSVRNATTDGTSPVSISNVRFYTQFGDVVTTRVENQKPYEVNLWVDVLDVPVDTPITISMTVGASDRGAFRLETLVMAFDRGYAPLVDAYGNEASLFSFTLLGVNKESGSVGGGGGGGLLEGNKLPAWGIGAIFACLVGAAWVARKVRQ